MNHLLKEILVNSLQIFTIIGVWELFNRFIILTRRPIKETDKKDFIYYFCYIGIITVTGIIMIVALIINSFINNYFSIT